MTSSSTPRGYRYDVFLSFRGEDTRKTIVSHLQKELDKKNISIFKDDRSIKLGDTVSKELHRAIHTSRFAVVVISKHYANSSWCLEELRLIMKLEKKKEIGVVPIFYQVDPSDVRKGQGSFDLKKHVSTENAKKVPEWRQALARIAGRSGMHSSNCKDEATMVQDIVQTISSRVLSMLPTDLSDIVGIEAHMECLRPLLDMDSDDEVRMIGIWGMGGIGKTAIAKYLYEQHKLGFSRHHYFIKYVEGDSSGLSDLNEQLLSNILGKKLVKSLSEEERAKYISSKLGKLKVFVVLDNVYDVDQLYPLAEEATWLGPGSRIIITTRDKSLLNSCGVSMVYNVKCLDDDSALQLFRKSVFRGGKPPSHVYKRLSKSVSRLAQGLPLALKALGISLRGKAVVDWIDALKSFEEAPHENIIKILKISYDSLDELGKTVFLHVACLFNGDFAWRVMNLLNRGEVGINILLEKSLIDITAKGYIAMHALVEQTGKQIVRQDSRNSRAQQRLLWHDADIYPLLENKAGTSENEGVALDVSRMPDDFHLGWNDFMPMYNLKLLKIYKHSGGLYSCRDGLILEENLCVPRQLKLLHWDAYPFTTLPSRIRPEWLVELNLCYSKLTTLWSGATPKLWNLRRLDLTGSKDLKLLPDLKEAEYLEELILKGCISLKWIPKSVCRLSKLVKLDVSNCSGLKNLRITIGESNSTVFQSRSLRVRSARLYFGARPVVEESWGISLSNISLKGKINIELNVLQGYAEHVCFISWQHVTHELLLMVGQQPNSRLTSPIYGFKSLDVIRFSCNEESGLFKCYSFSDFPWLMKLNLINLNIQEIPDDIHHMRVLETLDLSGNGFRVLPATMIRLTKLKHLTLCNCRILEALPELYQLETLTLSDCTNLRALVNFGHAGQDQGRYGLLELWLDNCKKVQSLSYQLTRFQSLTYLDISRHDFETVPTSIMSLTSLVTLCLNYCNNLISLEELPLNLKCLNAHGCNSLVSFSLPINQSVDQLDLNPCFHWKDPSKITRFPAGRQSKEVPLCACACFQETEIPSTDNQMTWSPKTIILQRVKPFLWVFAMCILVVCLVAILLVTGIHHFTLSTSNFHFYLDTLLMVIILYRSF